MIDSRDEVWLKRVLADCFPGQTDIVRYERNLTGFKIIVANLVKELEKKVAKLKKLSEQQQGLNEMKEGIDILAKHLFYLRRFCQKKTSKT